MGTLREAGGMSLLTREWNMLLQGWKSAGPLGTLISGIVGGVCGIVVAFMVICSLVEISLSFFEAVMFGCVLIFVGAFMIWRSLDSGDVQPPVFFRAIMYITSFGLCVDRHCRGGFGGLVALSGGCCF